MSSNSSNYMHDLLMKAVFHGTSLALGGDNTLNVGLLTTVSGSQVEVSGGSYARIPVTRAAAQWTVSGTNFSNTNQILFASPTANWGTITHVAIYNAASGGNALYTAALAIPRTVNNGDGAPRIAPGQLVIAKA